MYFYNYEFETEMTECICGYECTPSSDCDYGCVCFSECISEDEIERNDVTFSMQMNLIIDFLSEISWKIIYASMVVIALICASVFAPTIANGFFNFMVYIGGCLSLL